MPQNPYIRISLSILLFLVIGGTLFAIFISPSHSNNIHKSANLSDKASNDTPLETLKTLTNEISSVELQNQKIIEKNKMLSEEDKTTRAQFKSDVLTQVGQQIEKFKNDTKNNTASNSSLSLNDSSKISEDTKNSALENTHSDNQTNWTWVKDMQVEDEEANPTNKNNSASSHFSNADMDLSHLLNQDHSNDNNKISTNDKDKTPLIDKQLIFDSSKTKSIRPYYTIPVNATLTGAIAMQPIIGRIPIEGKVPDPYTFKAIIGPKNLAANGIDIPEDLQGIVVSGIAEGDLLGSCARGDIQAMTFVFSDGRISTTEAKDNQNLGTISAANGNPCISGSFHTDAPLFLGITAGLAGLQGYSNALSQSQLNTTMTSTGESISSLIGNANRFAMGQGFSASSQAAQKWWNQRVESSFDFVYVPNVDAKTGEKLKLNINITQEIAIDYDSAKRKVFYTIS